MGYSPVRQVTFHQTTPSSTWTITHFGGNVPVIDVYCEIDGVVQKMIPLSISVVDAKTVEIEFSIPRSGIAVIAG